MAELTFDVVEEILIRLDVTDLIRCKSVCKSWQSLISSPRFVKAHLKHAKNKDLNNHEIGHRRIGMGISMGTEDDELGYFYNGETMDEAGWLSYNRLHVVGSCNGLVCLSPQNAEFVVTNPSTREQKNLPMLFNTSNFWIRDVSCWGFGYDSSADDYKVVVGSSKQMWTMGFHVITLKSNTWRFIRQVEYEFADGISGILCSGALHWFLGNDYKKVIVSLNLSTEEFKEIPQPVDEEYNYDDLNHYKLGVIEGCLCIFLDRCCFSSKKWVMKNNKWERYNNGHCENKYDVAHIINTSLSSRVTNRMYARVTDLYGVTDGEHVSSGGSYIRANIFVKSLVSPHPDDKQQGKEGIAMANIRKRKRNSRSKADRKEGIAAANIRKRKRNSQSKADQKEGIAVANIRKRKRNSRSKADQKEGIAVANIRKRKRNSRSKADQKEGIVVASIRKRKRNSRYKADHNEEIAKANIRKRKRNS